MREPNLFLMDEPLSNLDAKLRVSTRAQIKHLHHKLKVTTIYVTHDQVEAMTMGDRIAIMNSGRIEQVDTPAQIYNTPKNKFVASFIGMPQMNFIEGNINSENGRFEFANKDMKLKLEDSHPLNHSIKKNRKVILGIRPEDIHDNLSAEMKNNPNTISAEVEMVENMGSHNVVHVKIGNSGICAELRNYNENNKQLDLIFDMNKSHFFDTNNGGIIE